MPKLKLQTQVTVDGYMGGPNGEMDWMHFPWSSDMAAYVTSLMDGVDTIVLGRKLAEGFIPHWAAQPKGETQDAIDFMNNKQRVVISRTLTVSPWENATIESDLSGTVADLKERTGGDIIAYGGSTLVQRLIADELIDELHLFVNPTAIGSGLPVFPNTEGYQSVRLVKATPFECGTFALHYAPKRS